MSRMPLTDLLFTTNYAVWSIPGYRLEGDYGKIESKQEEVKEYEVLVVNDECVFSFPFDILELIMKFCDDVDYFNFRATCKQLATLPVIRWSNITEIQQSLQTYSLVSPWSMVLDNDRGIITITDSMLGNKYFIRTSQDLVGDVQIHYSKNGWLLMSKNTSDLMFFNPFTSDIRKLPPVNISHVDEFCFSAGPTSPDCMVFGLGTDSACIYFVGREQSWAWRTLSFTGVDSVFRFPTFYGQEIYALNRQTHSVLIRDVYFDQRRVSYVPYHGDKPFTNYYLTKSDQHILLVCVGVFEKSVEVHKLNQSTMKLEKLKSLGKDVIYVSETACLCIEATTPKMENKVYFHQSYSENSTILFYSLETGRFHALDDDDMQGSFGDLFKHKRLLRPHTWIEPGCS